MATREETKRAGEHLFVGLLVGFLHLAWLSERFALPTGGGGLTYLAGLVFTTGILWTMLALRTIANGGAVAPELDDGLTSMAVTAWVMALVPPRASNFWSEGSTDDFGRVYLPLCLGAVFAVLAAQKLWPERSERNVWTRLFASTVPCALGVAGLLVFAAGGPEAGSTALRAAGVAGVAAVGWGLSRVFPRKA